MVMSRTKSPGKWLDRWLPSMAITTIYIFDKIDEFLLAKYIAV